ncbi:MAG: TonB-dependent receptor [Cytophagia bacterium]|nr:MAG: TonB-dependent receptor [Cytophagia bacterium]
MKKTFFLFIFILLCYKITAQDTKLTGIVADSFGKRIAFATIYLGEKYITQSNKDGLYEFNNIEMGKYSITFKADLYQTLTQEIMITRYHNLEVELIFAPPLANANTGILYKNLETVVVNATRVGDENGVAYSNISKNDIEKLNVGQDLPVLLNFQPSVISTSDAGAGVGYTGIRIRGSDATRTNVTINGIPVNDAESQGVFWVNMSDLASSVQSIQIQRGVGASANGAGAFGASVNIQTDNIREKSFFEFNNSYGSFNTWKNTFKFGTGHIKKENMKGHFALEGRLSRLVSDGFIDRAKSDLKSYYLSGGYFSDKTIIKFVAFSGKEKTYQAWNGVPESRLRNDVAEMQNYIIRNGLDNADAQNLLNANARTYNAYTYNNQIDDYQQDNYQAFFIHSVDNWDFNVAVHYTKGRGFFEQYRKNDKLENYNLADVIIGNQTIRRTDLIRRRWLDNDFYGTVFSANYQKDKIDFTLGGAWNTYQGKHFGEVIWAKYMSNGDIRHRYYDNDATKKDFNIYAKINYEWIQSKLNTTLDLQYRNVQYNFLGLANDNFGIRTINQDANFNFFNPKLAVNYKFDAKTNAYASFSVGNKEPNRDDFTQSSLQSRPKNETLLDYEVGFRKQIKSFAFQVNGYLMDYQNQLVLTGQVNDVGGYTRQNIAKSYRLGIETELSWKITSRLSWTMNATLSQNKIQNFKEFTDDFDNGGQIIKDFSNTDIAFSPNIIAGNVFEYKPFKSFTIGLMSKYVGKQYLDNTSNENRKLDAYFTQDIRLNYSWQPKFASEISFNLLINNILNERYESNGYTFNYISGGERIVENFYFPQAGTHFLLGLGVKF